jgi:hypothetical protein
VSQFPDFSHISVKSKSISITFKIFSNSFLAAARNILWDVLKFKSLYFLYSTMSYTNNHINSSTVSGVNHVDRSIPAPINLETETGVMSVISKFAETHSYNDDFDISSTNDIVTTDPFIKYTILPDYTELNKLNSVISSLSSKMMDVKKNIDLINQRESLLALNSKTSKKRRRKREKVTEVEQTASKMKK